MHIKSLKNKIMDYGLQVKISERKAKIASTIGGGCYLSGTTDWRPKSMMNDKTRTTKFAKELGISEFEVERYKKTFCKEYGEGHNAGDFAWGTQGYNQYIESLYAKKFDILEEQARQEAFLKEQKILEQTFTTDKTEQQVAQEKAKAEQELAKAELEVARTSSANRLAQKGDIASARVLLGVQEAEGSWKKPVIISGIIVGAVTVGFGIYKMVK
ncbi:MAG: hypothetical protein ACW98D_16710 [Promethearchaeota archaeon]